MSVAWKRGISNRVGFALLVGSVCTFTLPSFTLAVMTNPQPVPANGPVKPPGVADRVPDHAPGEVLVKFKKDTPASEKQLAHAAADVDVLSEIPELGVQRVKSKRREATETVLSRYRNNPHVEYVEFNVLVHAQLVPNDPRFSELWGLHNTGQSGGSVDADVDAPEAWDSQTGNRSVIVADLDSGVDYTHRDLSANMWVNPGEIAGNGIDDDGNGYVDDVRGWDFANQDSDPFDDFGHGTHVAGTIAAVAQNNEGVVGVAWQASLMAVKFLDWSGAGTASDATLAIIYAADMGAKVANASWGCVNCYSQTMADAITYANQRNMLFVAAAGNDRSNNDGTPTYPCSYTHPNIICVAATDQSDRKASFSNDGATTVDLGAPGVDILSTVPTYSCPYCYVSGYALLSGTSMAAPHVAGAAALVRSHLPTASATEIKQTILGMADPVSGLAGTTVTGGRLNVARALQKQAFTIGATPLSQTVAIGQSVTFTITVNSGGAFNGAVTLALDAPNQNISGQFDVNPVVLPANGFAQSTLTVSTTPLLARGFYTLTVRGTDGLGENHTAVVTLAVTGPDFTLSVTPLTHYAGPGGSTSYTVSVQSFDGFNAPVALEMTPLSNISVAFDPLTVTPPADGSGVSTMTITTTLSIQIGTYYLTIRGTDGIRTRTFSVRLSVVGVDLTNTALSGPETAALGTPFAVSNTVQNIGSQGTEEVGGSFLVRFYLSADSTITPEDIPVGSRVVAPGLAAGSSHTGTATLIAPIEIGAGTYFIGAIADYGNEIPERDETNNVLTGAMIRLVSAAGSTPPQRLDWARWYDGPGHSGDGFYKVVTDSAGNAHVTGMTKGNLSYDFRTAKYDSTGSLLWEARYDSGLDDEPQDMYVDDAGNVYVTGYRTNGIFYITPDDVNSQSHPPEPMVDFITVKYDALGREAWVAMYDNGGDDVPVLIRGDAAGNVYVGGHSYGTIYTIVTYSPSGETIAVNRNAEGVVHEWTVDADGNVYLAGWNWGTNGTQTMDFYVQKFDTQGRLDWATFYDGPAHSIDDAHAIAVDSSGNVYVSGRSSDGTDIYGVPYDAVTIKLDPLGRLLWSARYNNGQNEVGNAIRFDEAGNVFVLGEAYTSTSTLNFLVLKYDPNGNLAWGTSSFPGIDADSASAPDRGAAAVDQWGNIYVTGEQWNGNVENGGTGYGVVTLKFSADGRQAWVAKFDNGSLDWASGLSLDAMGNVYVAGWSWNTARAGGDAVLLKYRQAAFTLLATPTSRGITPGSSTTYTVAVSLENGLSAPVTLSCAPVQSESSIGCTVAPQTVTPPPNGSANVTVTVTTTSATPLGLYSLTIGGTAGNDVESAVVQLQVGIPGSDLLMTGVTPGTTSVPAGETLSVTDSVLNRGLSGTGTFQVHYRLSINTIYGDGDDLILPTTRSVGGLAAGVTNSSAMALTLPPTTPPASYYVCAKADGGGVVAEADETNNTLCSTVTVTVPPADLVLSSVTSASTAATVGGSFPVSITHQNQGDSATGAFTIDVHLSADLSYGGADDVVLPPARSVASSTAGQSSSATVLHSVPSTTPLGTYYLCAMADSGNAIDEGSAEGNNTLCSASTITVSAPPEAPPLGNISTRARVETLDRRMIGGFIIGGSGSKQVLIRGRGPSMSGAPDFVSGTLANPYVRLYSVTAGAYIAQNDNWGDQSDPLCASRGYVCGTPTEITATGMDPCVPNPGQSTAPVGCANEAALLVTLPPGGYTAVTSGVSNGVGVGLVEVFDVGGSPSAQLANISTRAPVGTLTDRMIGGFIVGAGTGDKQVLIRARGPSMSGAPDFVSGTLANPYVRLYSVSAGAYVAQNDNWGDQSDPLCASSGYVCGTAAEITATGMDPCVPNPGQSTAPVGCANEAALLVTLPPGGYTAVVSGVNSGTGVGLVEIFEVSP